MYNDKRSCKEYLAWSKAWMSRIFKVLKPSGTFWLAIGDEYAAELKVYLRKMKSVSRAVVG